jgi:hypothetical protein
MKSKGKAGLGRRDFLLAAGAGAGAAATSATLFSGEAKATSESPAEERKARYQANSADVQAFYRVNHYPKK